MLLVWLFALASGWANACILQQAAPAHARGHDGAEQGLASHGARGATVGVVGHDGPAGDDAHGARRVCQSVCDDETSALPKVGTPSVPDLGPAILVPIQAWSFCAALARFPSGCPLAAAPPPEPAVAIRFLRLTL